MNIATAVLTHTDPRLTADTVDSVRTFVDDRVLVLVDKVGWPEFQNVKMSARVEEGFYHACKRSPYRNYALAIKKLYEYWPDSDWFVYTEFDCLFTSSGFVEDLKKAEQEGAWVVGVDLRRFDFEIDLLRQLLEVEKIQYSYYFLGCCQFLHRDFVSRCQNFIDRLLDATKNFENGHFPGYERWAFEEELWPTAATQMGGKLYELCCWKGMPGIGEWQTIKISDEKMIYAGVEHDTWRGRFKKYPIRNSPEIDEIMPEACIVHPVKTFNALRQKQRVERKRFKKVF